MRKKKGKKESKLQRTSYYSKSRTNYLSESESCYIYEFIDYDENGRPVPKQTKIAITDDTYEFIKTLDEMDNAEDRADRKEYDKRDLYFDAESHDEDGTEMYGDPLEQIPDPKGDPFCILFSETYDDTKEIESDKRLKEFYKTLKAEDIALIEEHIFNCKSLQEIAEETGKKVDALESRYRKIKRKASKFYGKDVPKK